MTIVQTFTATIYCGLREGRTENQNPIIHSPDEAKTIVGEYCDSVGLCVSLTPTQFIYTKGCEPGVIVGLINYPRFPSNPQAIRVHAIELAARLKSNLGQHRVSIVLPDETIMLH